MVDKQERNNSKMYRKRQGTSGIRGHLYETKLISLLLFRAKQNDNIEEIHLASNFDGIGAFDDICFRAKLAGVDRPLSVFIQAKHRENDNFTTLNDKELTKYFDSYMKIRRAFESNDEDVLFKGKFDETDCLFVLYTPARGDVSEEIVKGRYADSLNDLIGTSSTVGFHPSYNNENVEFLCKLALKDEVTSLAVHMAKFVCNEVNFQKLLTDELVLKYHVILAQKIMNVSDIQPEGHRLATFRKDFSFNNEEFVTMFRETFYVEVLRRGVNKNTSSNLDLFLNCTDSQDYLLSELIERVVTYNKQGKLEFIDKNMSDDLKRQLNKVYVSNSAVDKAIHKAAKTILTGPFKVPAAFGNRDLTVRGNDEKVEKRLNHLALTICDLLQKPQRNNKVVLDESLGKGFLQLNGGLAGTVGNILVLDENNEFMKFTDNCESLGDLSKRLLEKIKLKINDLHKYRFEIKVEKFPKLSFECSEFDKNLVQDFLNKLVFYTNQADEKGVEDILKNEIEEYLSNIGNNLRVRLDAIYLTYHDEIQNWWMSTNTVEYLTKHSKTHDGINRSIVEEPLMSIMNIIYRNKIKYNNYTFKDAATSLNFENEFSSIIIVTDISTLTVAKAIQYLKNKDHAILDLEYILNLPVNDCNLLSEELRNTNKILIFICEGVLKYKNINPYKTLEKISMALHDKNKIIITNQASLEIVTKYFPNIDINYESSNFVDMTDESKSTILKESSIIFQDVQVSLELIIDDISMMYVEGDVLNRILNNDANVLGSSLSDSNYHEIKYLYVDRSVRRGGKPRSHDKLSSMNDEVIETLFDIDDDVVLITAKPGMGKSTLLTHISLKTKEQDPKVWIVRINLLNYSREFSVWQENKTEINTLETLNFICQIVVSRKHEITMSLEEINGEVRLKDCASDQWTVFEIKMFLYFYNNARIIFLFDGFDEICPHYAVEVMQFLKTVRSYPRRHKMWIASRSYNKIKSILRREFGVPYEIEYFSYKQREKYLEMFWKTNLILNELDSEQLHNVHEFMIFMRQLIKSLGREFSSVSKGQNLPLHEIYFNVLHYFRYQLGYTYIPLWTYDDEFDDNELIEIFTRLRMRYNGDVTDMFQFIATPLHLYLLVNHFQNEIKDITKKNNKWHLDINTYTIYESFLETKLKKIRFQQKNKVDIFIPDNKITYEKEHADFIAKHKRIAAYAIFHRRNRKLFSRKELKEIKNTIKLIKKGGEKTGLIYSVTSNNLPIFVHRTFAEYFAVEYFCDMLKTETCNQKQEIMIDFIFNDMFFHSPANISNILDTKLLTDDVLLEIFKKHDRFIFDILMEQTEGYPAYGITDIRDEFYEIKYDSSLNFAVTSNLKNFVSLFILIIETHLDKENVEKFVKIIRKTRMFDTAIRVKREEFIMFALDVVRKIDESKINKMFNSRNISIFVNLSLKSNEELLMIIKKITHFTSSTTTPYYYYDADNDSYGFILR